MLFIFEVLTSCKTLNSKYRILIGSSLKLAKIISILFLSRMITLYDCHALVLAVPNSYLPMGTPACHKKANKSRILALKLAPESWA